MARRPPKTNNGVVLIADVGTPSSRLLTKGSTFAEIVKDCLLNFLKQRIFLNNSEDEVAIILCGSNNSNNELDYKHIEVLQKMEKVNWKMMDIVNENVRTNNCDGDWMDALGVALDIIHTAVNEGASYERNQILFFTAFESPSKISGKTQQAYISALSSKKTELVFIGSNVTDEKPSTEMNQSEIAACDLVNKITCDGGFYDFEEYNADVLNLTFQPKQGTAWNVTLDIGSSIKIPVSGYIKVSKSESLKWKEETSDGQAPVEKEKTYQKDPSNAMVDKQDVITSYKYGTTDVPVTKNDEDQHYYKSGNKCLSILAFVDPVQPEYLMDTGTKYFFAQRKAGVVDRSAQIALSAFIRAMEETGKVAIVRRVYQSNSKVTIGVLSPRIKLNYECLVFHELPFADDWRDFEFAPIITPKNQPTSEQLEAIDLLIDKLDLSKMEEGETKSPFDPSAINDPYEEYLRYVIALKALRPDDPLTDDIPPHIKMNLNPSPLMMANSKEVLERIKHLFPLEVVSRPKNKNFDAMKRGTLPAINKEETGDASPIKKTRMDEHGEIDLMALMKADVVKVGPVDPVNDFIFLLESGEKPIEKIYEEMADMIVKLLQDSGGTNKALMTKAKNCLQVYREHARREGRAIEYNRWMERFKDQVTSEYFGDFWKNYIAECRLGLITMEESPVSDVNQQVADQFLQLTVAETDEFDTLYDEELLKLL